jgi:hypothetical protein
MWPEPTPKTDPSLGGPPRQREGSGLPSAKGGGEGFLGVFEGVVQAQDAPDAVFPPVELEAVHAREKGCLGVRVVARLDRGQDVGEGAVAAHLAMDLPLVESPGVGSGLVLDESDRIPQRERALALLLAFAQDPGPRMEEGP